jgi:pyruvate/2-oxoglutarate dehydrogenase complex dihydrolipoamide acyltransferase (E2) component
MKRIIHLTSACLIAGLTCVAYGSTNPSGAAFPTNGYAASPTQQQQDDTKPKQDDTKPKQDAAKPQTDKNDSKAPKPAQDADKTQPRDARTQPDARPRGQSQPAANRASGNHGRITDSDYQAHFGQSHTFSVRTVVTTTRIVPNQTRFAYSGYSFVFLEPWPSGWMLTDDCYVDFINGEYVLIDLAHPGVQITLSIV